MRAANANRVHPSKAAFRSALAKPTLQVRASAAILAQLVRGCSRPLVLLPPTQRPLVHNRQRNSLGGRGRQAHQRQELSVAM